MERPFGDRTMQALVYKDHDGNELGGIIWYSQDERLISSNFNGKLERSNHTITINEWVLNVDNLGKQMFWQHNNLLIQINAFPNKTDEFPLKIVQAYLILYPPTLQSSIPVENDPCKNNDVEPNTVCDSSNEEIDEDNDDVVRPIEDDITLKEEDGDFESGQGGTDDIEIHKRKNTTSKTIDNSVENASTESKRTSQEAIEEKEEDSFFQKLFSFFRRLF